MDTKSPNPGQEDIPSNQGKSIISTFLALIEKILLPMALAFLAFKTSDAANKISEAQLKLAEAQNNRQEIEYKDNLQTKYIELFYQDISSQDLNKQKAALSFLKLINPEHAKPLINWAELNVKEELKPQVKSASKQINAEILKILSNYEIRLYFLKDNQTLFKTAQALQQSLIQSGLRAEQINLNEKDSSFFQRLGYPTAYEIRYDQGIEDRAAELLTNFLQEAYTDKRFIKRPIGSGTRNSLSIFFVK